MSETKFTKGNWIVDLRGGCLAVYEESRADETNGCHSDDERNIHYSAMGGYYDGLCWGMSEEAIANAHLIAAAPEMYEMLDELSVRLEEYAEILSNKEMLRQSLAAKQLLAKARGGS